MSTLGQRLQPTKDPRAWDSMRKQQMSDDPKQILSQVNDAFHRDQQRQREQAMPPQSMYQPMVFYTEVHKRIFKKPLAFTMPFYSSNIFLKKEDCIAYLPYFVKKLIKDGLLPAEAISEDGTLSDLVQPGWAPVDITIMETVGQDVENQ